MLKNTIIILLLATAPFTARAQEMYEFRNLGPQVNTPQDEFLPVVYNDTLYYRRITAAGQRNMAYEICRIACGDIRPALSGAVVPTVLPVYNTREYQNSSQPVDERASTRPTMKTDPSTPGFYNFTSDKLNIYKLANPQTLDFGISSEYNDIHPAMAPDGSFIVFASDRPKKRGSGEREKELDLYVSYRKPDGTWAKPQNLGKKINTGENELAPFIAADGSLYFSSKGYTRDNVNIVFSGEQRNKKKNLSDVYMIKEKINYNIIKAEPTGNNTEPFANPVMLPAPFNTEFNEIGATVWKDTMLYIVSDRLEPYDRPDPLNKTGYDIYGYVADPLPPQPQAPPAINFFVTGYYRPNTPANLSDLRQKMFMGVFGTNASNDYVADPNNDYDESGEPIDYDSYSLQVSEYFGNLDNTLLKWLEYIDRKGRGSLEITVSGYSDPRPIQDNSKFVEKNIDDKEFAISFNKGAAVSNDSLSLLRAYFTAKHIRTALAKNARYQKLAGRIKWKIEGKGELKEAAPNEKKRKIDIVVNYNN